MELLDINSKVLLYSTENCIPYLVINYNEKEFVYNAGLCKHFSPLINIVLSLKKFFSMCFSRRNDVIIGQRILSGHGTCFIFLF